MLIVHQQNVRSSDDNCICQLSKPSTVIKEWWNGAIGSRKDEPIPEKININQFIMALISISQPLVLMYDPSASDEFFCQSISQFVSYVSGHKQIINPLVSFPGFLTQLYEYRQCLKIDTAEKVIKLLSLCPNPSDQAFLMWRFPEKISSELFFESLVLMNNEQNIIWRNFCQKAGNLDVLFDRYIPMIGSSVSLIELLNVIYRTKYSRLSNFFETSQTLWNALLIVVKSSRLSCATAAFRMISIIYPKLRPNFLELLQATQHPNPLHYIILRFLFQERDTNLTRLAKFIISQQTLSEGDFLILHDIVESQCLLIVIHFLMETSCNSKIWTNVSMNCMPTILDPSVIEFVQSFVQKMFEFIALSNLKKKYTSRNIMTLKFAKFLYIRYEPLRDQISKLYSSITPLVPVSIPLQMHPDLIFMRTISTFPKDVKLKNFLHVPSPTSSGFVQPLVRISNSTRTRAKPRIQTVNIRSPGAKRTHSSPKIARCRSTKMDSLPMILK